VQHVAEWRTGLAAQGVWVLPSCYDLVRTLPPALAPLGAGGGWVSRVRQADRGVLRELRAYEDRLAEDSVCARAVRPWVQYAVTRWLGTGNEKAYCGRRPWLFYRPDVDYVTGAPFLAPATQARRVAASREWETPPQPDPLAAILRFRGQLAARGIRLIVMPTPVKPTIQPAALASGRKTAAPVQNLSHAALVRALEREGVMVFDVAPALASAAQDTGRPPYLQADTHWRPEAVGLAAARLREYIAARALLPPAASAGYAAADVEVAGHGDVARMLDLPAGQTLFPIEQVRLRQIVDARRQLWRSEATADVLVLGDSFSNIYSLEGLGWGEAAGFVEQLSFALQRPLDRIVRNDNGAYATRAELARELARGRDRLAGKRLVIWQFAARELSHGDWRNVELALGAPPPAGFLVLAPGAEADVRGTVAAVSPVPRPGTVPYKDHILSLHLVDIEGAAEAPANAQALVYLWSMRNNRWTAAARYRPGDTVVLRLRPWADVAARCDGFNRSELDDTALQMQAPCWGEEATR
jgi:alginate O-acetyltransferase complex protein AlgJ